MNKTVRFKCYLEYDIFKNIKSHIEGELTISCIEKSMTKVFDNVKYKIVIYFKNAGKNYIDVITEFFGEEQLLGRNIKKIDHIEDIFLVQLIHTKDEIDICMAFEVDVNISANYYLKKREVHYYLTQETVDYVYRFAYYASLMDRIERIEILYCILIKKISSGKYGHIQFKEYLLDNLDFLGYDNDYCHNYKKKVLCDAPENHIDFKNSEEIFNYLIYLLLENLFKRKNNKMSKFKKIQELNNVYDMYYVFLEKEGFLKQNKKDLEVI